MFYCSRSSTQALDGIISSSVLAVHRSSIHAPSKVAKNQYFVYRAAFVEFELADKIHKENNRVLDPQAKRLSLLYQNFQPPPDAFADSRFLLEDRALRDTSSLLLRPASFAER